MKLKFATGGTTTIIAGKKTFRGSEKPKEFTGQRPTVGCLGLLDKIHKEDLKRYVKMFKTSWIEL